MTLKSIRKILSITLSAIFFLQQGGFVFATTNVSTWADLYIGIAGSADEYHVTTPLTAFSSPYGTLAINANGYSVTGATLTGNSTNDSLFNIASSITFGLGNNISGNIVNNGVLNYSGSSLANGAVTGNGTFNFLGGILTNGNTINQKTVFVEAGSSLTNNEAITATNFRNNGVVNNNAAINGTITNQGTLTSTADNLIGTVENNSTLNLKGGTVQAAISGSGNTNITGNLSSDYAIEQTNVAISNNAYVTQNATLTAAVSNASGSTLEIAPDNLAGAVDNAGTLKFNAGGSLAQDITGTGLTRFDGSSAIVLDDANSIAQDTIKVGTSATFTANASNLSATTEIFNDGQLNLTGGTNANAINGDGSLYITTADVTNEQSITQTALTATTGNLINNDTVVVTNLATESTGSITNNDSITVAEAVTNLGVITNKTGATLDNSASTGVFTNSGTVNNDGTINTVNFTNNGNVSGNGTTNITGDSFNAGTITQGLVTIDNNATFTNNGLLAANVSNASGSTLNSDPDNLGGNVTNDGTLNLNAAGTLTIDVTGVGETNILGDLENKGSITQDDININSGVVVTTNASDMTAANDIANEGIINYTGGTTNNTITGAGRVDITGYVTNTGDITQTTVSNTGVFTNNGTVTANLENSHDIEGTGSITTGTGISSNSGNISQTTITNNGTFDNTGHITLTGALTNNNTFNTNADLISAAGGIANEGNLNITGGTNANDITGTNGVVNFSNTVVNNASITNDTVSNTGILTNNGSITADVNNSGTLNSDAGNISGNINNTGTYEITGGTNNNTVSGSGTTSILGATVNSGSITQNNVTIASTGSLTTAADTVTANINNAGTLTWDADSTNSNVITGSGALNIAADVTNNASISQESVNVSGTLTTNADLIASNNGIYNTGDVVLTGGTNNNAINGNGDLEITGAVNNNALIDQNIITVSGGKLTTAADALTTANGIVNNDAISFTGGDNYNEITGSGTTFIDGNVQNLANVYTETQVNTGAHYGIGMTDIHANVENRGTLDLIESNIDSSAKIKGTGITNILGDTTNNGRISQSALNIAAGGALHSDSEQVDAAITNDGTYEITSGTNNTNVISGSGSLVVSGGDITNNAAISQNNISITGGSLTSNADLLSSVGGIDNAADLILTGGTNNNVITGTGDLATSGDVTNKADITQNTLTNTGNFLNDEGSIVADITNSGVFVNADGVIAGDITNSGTFYTDGSDVNGDINNSGDYVIVDGDNSNDITGTGDVTIQGDTINTTTIAQDTITIDNGATLVATDISDITTTSAIDNAGTLEMQAGTNTNNITGNTGITKITGNVDNNSGVSISQDSIEIATLGALTAYADDLTTVNGITNSGALTLNDGTNNNNISGNGTLAVIGTVDNNGNIAQASLTNSGTLTSDASLLAFANGLTNNNVLNLTDGINANVIDGTGTTNFTNNVVNNGQITQTDVTNASGTLTNNAAITADFANNGGTVENNAAITGDITNTGTINSSADNLVGTVANDGILNIAGGTVQDTISGTGVMNITEDLVNAQSITQTTVNNNAIMENSGAITADFNNSGTVNNTAAITGAITNDGTINSTADNLHGAIVNDGTLNIAGGTVQDTISGTGVMNITDDLVNAQTINQTTVNNEANLTNSNVITATNINNTGVISGAAVNLVGAIANEGTLVFNAASTGASNISGTGDVQVTANTTLSGTNTYTGETLIDGATLTIAGQDNISTSDVLFANDGILEVTTAGTLNNVLKGQAATDNVTVQNNDALTLNTAIGESADFHKAGAGIMTLAMDSNSYTGNTYVDNGTLIGNTLNINNTVIGAAGTTVNFNDTANAELNEINTLGNFVKSGNGLLNVENNAFTAAQADINSGIFAANRAITADVVNVNNGATLRGNGNITGNVNVNNGGTIAPGNSIDTLTVTGDVNFASGSTTAIEINETPASDLLVITGNANIESGANLTVSNENGRYFEWDSFEIVNAGNVAGTFTYDGTITDYDASRINVELDYSDPTKVLLTAKRKATDYSGTTAAGLSRNQSEAAKAIDAVSTGFGGDITSALLQIEKLGGLNPEDVTLINPNSTLQTALDDIAGALYSNSALATLFNAKTAHVYDRIAKRSPSAGACPNCHDNVWVEYYNQYDKVYSDENSPRFTNNMTGVLVGYDRSSEEALLGVYAGFSKSDLHQNGGSKMDLDDTTLGVYGGYRTGDWLFKGTLFGGVQHYNAKRAIAFMGRTANGSYDGVNLGLDLEGSYSIPVYNWLTVRPFIGWLNNYSHQNAFTENGADDLNLHVFGNDQFNSQVRLGVQLEGTVKNRLSWYGSAAVKQFVGNDYAKLHMNLDNLPNTDMEIISAELGRTYFSGQAGLTYKIDNSWSIFGNLDAGLSNKSANCYANIGLAYTW